MAQHDYVIANGTGAAVRSDLNNALAAIVSQNSGATEPTTTYAYMPWADTGSSPPVFKIRNAANNGWITLYELDGTFSVEAGSASSPGLYFTGDINTGIYSPGADQFGISTGGTSRLVIDASGNINMDSGAVYVDAANNRLGINTTTPANDLDVLRTASGSTATARIGATATSGVNNATLILNNGGTGDATLRFDYESSTNRASIGVVSSAQALTFGTAGSTRATIDSSGRLLVNTSSTANLDAVGARFEAHTAASEYLAVLVRNGGTSPGGAPGLVFARSRGTSIGSKTAVANGDSLGIIYFRGANGTNYDPQYAQISAEVDAAPGVNSYPGRLVFSTTASGGTSPTERMRINNAGAQYAYSTSDGITASVSAAAASSGAIFEGRHSATAVNTGTGCFVVRYNGDVLNTNNSYGQISDIKLKENIVDANSQWSDIKAVRVRNFNFKEGQTHRQIGVIAQELEEVSPGLVSESPDRDEDGNDLDTVTKSVNYSVLYMKAVKALQEAMERIETLEAKVAALEAS